MGVIHQQPAPSRAEDVHRAVSPPFPFPAPPSLPPSLPHSRPVSAHPTPPQNGPPHRRCVEELADSGARALAQGGEAARSLELQLAEAEAHRRMLGRRLLQFEKSEAGAGRQHDNSDPFNV